MALQENTISFEEMYVQTDSMRGRHTSQLNTGQPNTGQFKTDHIEYWAYRWKPADMAGGIVSACGEAHRSKESAPEPIQVRCISGPAATGPRNPVRDVGAARTESDGHIRTHPAGSGQKTHGIWSSFCTRDTLETDCRRLGRDVYSCRDIHTGHRAAR